MKWIIILIVFIAAICSAVVVRGCGTRPKVPVVTALPDTTKYDIFVENWNRSVVNAKLGKLFYLPDTDPEGVITILNSIIAPFFKCPDPAFRNELANITQGRKYSFFSFYGDFIKSHCIDTELIFNSKQDSTSIKKNIAQITKIDKINTKALIIIGSMNAPCFYLKNYRDDLYVKGMTRNIKSCEDIKIDESKYPLISKILKN